jgi:hypothetical protein
VRINGIDHHAVAPQFNTFGQAAPMLGPLFRAAEQLVFKLLGIRQFMRLQLAAR